MKLIGHNIYMLIFSEILSSVIIEHYNNISVSQI